MDATTPQCQDETPISNTERKLPPNHVRDTHDERSPTIAPNVRLTFGRIVRFSGLSEKRHERGLVEDRESKLLRLGQFGPRLVSRHQVVGFRRNVAPRDAPGGRMAASAEAREKPTRVPVTTTVLPARGRPP